MNKPLHQYFEEINTPLVATKEQKQGSFIFWTCIVGVGVICLFSSCQMTPARASEITYSNEQIADAIFKAENSVKYPYGIKSINTHGSKEYARKICLNTIRNNRKRFSKQSQYKDFLSFLGSRYCPTTIKAEYSLNQHWVSNVKYFLAKGNNVY